MINRANLIKRLFITAGVLAGLWSFALAKDPPSQVIVWPEQGSPVVRFTFGKFKEVASVGSERTYMTDTTAANLWTKRIEDANFILYCMTRTKCESAKLL